jgi:hypothetical protein
MQHQVVLNLKEGHCRVTQSASRSCAQTHFAEAGEETAAGDVRCYWRHCGLMSACHSDAGIDHVLPEGGVKLFSRFRLHDICNSAS